MSIPIDKSITQNRYATFKAVNNNGTAKAKVSVEVGHEMLINFTSLHQKAVNAAKNFKDVSSCTQAADVLQRLVDKVGATLENKEPTHQVAP
jgi:hypothetical protein